MGFDLNGYVLRPARAATGNSSDADEATTGVDRDHITPATMTDLGYDVVPADPVEPYADMYRAAVLQQPTSRAVSREYCLFAARTGFLSSTDDEVRFWWTRNDPDDGVKRFGWDGLAQKWLPLKGTPARNLGPVDPDEGYKLNPPPTRFSPGDTLPYAATADEYALVRVGLYADAGSTPLNILVVTDAEAEGPWNSAWDALPAPYPFTSADAVLGSEGGVLLLNPSFAETQAGRDLWYNAETFVPDTDGDMGDVAGFPTTDKQGFPSLCPIPGPTERPFLRIGNRTYLTPVSVATDGDLPNPDSGTINTGEFYWSRTTGKIVLSKTDIDRCTPGETGYEIPYLGARLYFDGVSLSTRAIRVRAPSVIYDEGGNPLDPALGGVTVGDSSGNLYVQRAVCLPPPGVSGVAWVPDGSGDRPTTLNLASTTPQTRPNGTGLVRQVLAEAGDTFFFSFSDDNNFAFENVDLVEYDDDLPALKIKVPKTDVAVSRMEPLSIPTTVPDHVSRIKLRTRPVRKDALYFRQAMLIPSVYSERAIIYSRFEGPYTLNGTEVLRYALDSVVHTWNAPSAGDYTADEIAASFPVGHAGVERGRVYLTASDPDTGSVEIGWNEDPGDGSTNQRDLSGHAALGFLPGWRVDMADDTFRWLPDNGASMGVFRSPVNLDRSDPDTPDIRHRSSFDDEVLVEDITAVPFVTVNQHPLEDIDGYGPDQHFKVQIGLLGVLLKNYQTTLNVGVKYDWPNNRFSWLAKGSTSATSLPFPAPTLQLSDVGIFPETVSSAAMLDGSFGLDFKGVRDISYAELTQGVDYLMPGEGQPGQAVLIDVEGGVISQGGNGTFNKGSSVFSDPNTSLGTVLPGYLLHILNGDAEGVYTFTSPTEVTPAFPADGGSTYGAPPAQWRIYEAKTREDVDRTLLADVQQVVKNHLPDEPFKIRLLTAAGSVGSTLTVNPVDALRVGRATSLRFGLEPSSDTASPTYLTRGVGLGAVAEEGLFVDPTDPHVSNSTTGSVYFQIRIGAEIYVPTVNGGGGLVDVDTTTGAVVIDSSVVSAQTGSGVFYDQLFLAPADLAAGTCEINASNGEVNISAVDSAANFGKTAYYIEEMITRGSLDVTTSPLNGSIVFNKPLRAGQIVEVNYYQADTDGDKKLDEDGNPVEITEFLALIVRLEEATRVDDLTFEYNPTGRTLSTTVEEFIWAGVELQNFAGVTTATAENGVIKFINPVDPADKVQINYGVLEAFGGETAYTVSSPPVYRKPFWLNEGQDTFTLETDRTADFPVGHLILLGTTPLYIETSTYTPATDTTEITVFPPPQTEVGSRAVGRDASLSVSDFAVLVGKGGAQGFMPLLDTTVTPLLPADKGQLEVSFFGDVRQYAKPNHLLEIDGYPYIITNSEQSADGRNTLVSLATPVYKDHDNTQVVRVSVRPVLSPSPITFLGLGEFVTSEEYDLFLLGRKDANGNAIPGKHLVENVHYTVNTSNGDVTFQGPTQEPLNPGEYLHFRYTRMVSVGPTIVDDAILYPFYKSTYLHLSAPSDRNGVKGKILKAKYTYRDPDSFYFGVLTLTDYLPQVQAASSAQGPSPVGFGAVVPFGGSTDLSKKGRFGLRGEARDFKDQDRAARVYISLFNGVILAFEQVLEAIDGRIIGDRDGKFRFFVGRGARYVRPGWEDQITGDLRSRLIWREIISEWSPDSFDGWYKTSDPAYNPVTAELPNNNPSALPYRPGETDGETPNSDTLRFFTDRQRGRIKNDMDDRLLIGFARPRGLAALFPSIDIPGRFKSMWQAHRYSRLFPELSRHFTRLFPGIDFVPDSYEGFYTSGRKVTVPGPEQGEETEQIVKTRKSPIGQIANPALGNINGVVDVTAQDRLPRARVWAYYPNGNTDITPGTNALIVATPLPLSEFPVNPTTGLPDASQLISSSGELIDLKSGDPDLSTPAFEVGQRLNYGKPDDTVYTLTTSGGKGIVVDDVISGYAIVLGDGTNPVSGSDVLYNGTDPLDEIISEDDGYGDTVFCGPVVDMDTLSAIPSGNLPTSEDEAEAIIAALPDYRIQFDLKVGKRSGEFIDASLPVKDDVFPLPLQTWLNQNPPQPMTCIEGEVEFVNADNDPVRLPCLLGEDKDDTGDYQIPYIRGADTELSVLGRVAADFRLLFEDTAIVPPHTWLAVYPDEIIGEDGAILTSGYDIGTQRDPATLYTSTDLTPVATAGYDPNSGIGDARPYDFLFVQTEQSGVPVGITGILSIGDVTTNKIETPRFVTSVPSGALVRHTIENAAVAVNRSGAEGVIVTESNPFPGQYGTTFNCDSVGFVLDDGQGGGPPGVGGYNLFFGAGRAVLVRIFDPTNGSLIETIVVSGVTVWSTSLAPGGTPMTGAPYFIDGRLVIETTSPVSSVANDGNYYDVTVSVDCYIDSTTDAITGLGVGSGVGTTSASIQADRLTFTERISLAEAADRNTVTASPAEIDVSTTLAVWEVEVDSATGCTVNAPAEVNGGARFTFLERLNGVVPYVGEFTPATVSGAGDEEGSIKVMPWEKDNNTPLAGSDLTGIKFAAAASSNAGASDLILSGVGTNLDRTNLLAMPRYRAWFQNVSATSGSLSNIESGDVLVVEGGTIAGTGAVKAGTYLVRHAVDSNTSASDGTDILSTNGIIAKAGRPEVIDISFPKILSSDETTTSITTSALTDATESPTGHAWDTSGRLYLILQENYATYDSSTSEWTVIQNAVWSAAYTGLSIDAVTGAATFTGLSSFRDAYGSAVTLADFFAAAVRNVKVSGMSYLPIRQLHPDLPANNCVGYNLSPTGNPCIGGVQEVHLGSSRNGGGDIGYIAGGTLIRYAGVITPGSLQVIVPLGADSTLFYPERDRVIYSASSVPSVGPNPVGVAACFDVSDITAWDDQHFDTTVNTILREDGGALASTSLNCFLPGDRMAIGESILSALSRFHAVSGVFLEPSIPKPVTNLGQVLPHVVANDYAGLTIDQIGLRDYEDFFSPAPGVGAERVRLTVRRIRRFHEQADEVVAGLDPLRYAYEIRRGEVSGYTASSREFVADTAGTYSEATNLGAFDNDDVNINAGDVLRIIDPATGRVTDTAEVQKVVNPVTLKLRRPGLTEDLPTDALFEVYLEQAIVPHEQSNEQLFDLITDKIVYERRVDYPDGDTDGGYVPTVNEMRDNLVDLEGSWSAATAAQTGEVVAEGDYIVIDPAGQLYLDTEFGVRPFGDTSVVERAGVFDSGPPSDLDDNRGFYKVTSVDSIAPGVLEVDGESRFTDGTKFGEAGAAEYVVMPTVNNGAEGQQDLRVTEGAVGNSFIDRGTNLSIEPFAYKIIRPNPLFSQDSVELVLFMRERMLSWIEALNTVYTQSGDYYVFQRDDHIKSLGSNTDPTSGLGVLHNIAAEALQGLVDVTPYANNSQCLSVLDRRFWVLDSRLDALGYTDFAVDGFEQRPVLPDLIDDVLDLDDRFRQQRYSWITFRANRTDGSIQTARRASGSLERRLEKQRDALARQKALDESS